MECCSSKNVTVEVERIKVGHSLMKESRIENRDCYRDDISLTPPFLYLRITYRQLNKLNNGITIVDPAF